MKSMQAVCDSLTGKFQRSFLCDPLRAKEIGHVCFRERVQQGCVGGVKESTGQCSRVEPRSMGLDVESDGNGCNRDGDPNAGMRNRKLNPGSSDELRLAVGGVLEMELLWIAIQMPGQ